MQTFLEFYIQEKDTTKKQLNVLEKHLDKLFSLVGGDVEFTRHFLERMNDPRNGKDIDLRELALVFREFYIKYKDDIKNFKNDFEAVINDITSDINIPFVIDRNGDNFEITTKTIMRKKNFKTPDKKLKVKT